MNITRNIAPGMTITIELTEEELEQAYRGQQENYRMQDVQNHIEDLCEQYSAIDDETGISEFETKFGFPTAFIVDDDKFAKDFKNACLAAFEENFDCNEDENTMWESAITKTIKDWQDTYRLPKPANEVKNNE